MAKVMEPTDIDPVADQVDAQLSGMGPMRGRQNDLSDGGTVTTEGVRARVHPMTGQGGRRMEKGRPAARRAWMWDGTETLLPLAWNPEGTAHDGARRYLLKRHCTCCNLSGFRTATCPTCEANGCAGCNGGSDTGKVIPCFYLRKEDVPFPRKFHGNIDCFLEGCPRRGKLGFLTQQDMRMHARTRHRMEYQVYLDTLNANRVDEVTSLREQVNKLLAAQIPTPPKTEEPAPLYQKTPRR